MIKTWPSRLARRFRDVFAFVFGGVLLTIGIGILAAQQPNIVVIMADDLGWKDLSIQGNETLDTPHLDKLAREGIRFTNGYAAAPVCSPTRAAMMTGLHPARLGITNHAPGHQEGFRPKNR